MATSSQLERFWLLAGLKLNKEASEEELQELEQLTKDNPELKELLNAAGLFYHFEASDLPLPDGDESFAKHKQRLNDAHKSTRARILRISLVAGGIAACFFAVFFIAHYRNTARTNDTALNEVTSRFGSKSMVQLPDGTQVWLNADSRLTYGKDFGTRQREVFLSGEAFFNVAKDADNPFILHAGALNIKVLGTAFNIRSYQGERTSEATLLRGAIEVTLNTDRDHKILLKPSERLVVRNTGATVPSEGAKPADSTRAAFWLSRLDDTKHEGSDLETIWKKNGLVFRNEPLENVAGRIEHWFNVKVSILDEDLKEKTFSCDFKHESLHEVMEALHLTGGIGYRIVKDSVLITK